MVKRRITIDSTPTQRGRHALCSGGLKRVGHTAKVAPEPPSARPFQAGQKGATASRVNRALYGRNKVKVRHLRKSLVAIHAGDRMDIESSYGRNKKVKNDATN
jgi:hypothetical protein